MQFALLLKGALVLFEGGESGLEEGLPLFGIRLGLRVLFCLHIVFIESFVVFLGQ